MAKISPSTTTRPESMEMVFIGIGSPLMGLPYSRLDISGDGQVVVIEFSCYTVELVPGFKQSDNRFKYPDTHDGGSWKYTDPLPEQDTCQECDDTSNGIYFDFCHIVRKWKNEQGFKFGGLLIDTLVYDHFEENDFYKDSSIDDYFDILKNILAYLGAQDKNRTFWYAVGSNQQVMNSGKGTFVDEASDALVKIETAESEDNVSAVLQEILGDEWLNKDLFRIGASSLVGDIEKRLGK